MELVLPPNKTYEDKYYIGFYVQNKMVGVMDLVLKYPQDDTAYIGLFMTDKIYQGKRLGTKIINDISCFLAKEGFTYIKLGCIEENKEGTQFWLKNNFREVGKRTKTDKYSVISLEKVL